MRFPVQAAKLYHALAVKIGIRIAEPLGFKGGEIAKIYKGTGKRSIVGNSRGVLLSSTVGKKVHKAYERRTAPLLSAYCQQSQCGGINGRGTDFAAHGMRLVQKLSVKFRKSSFFIFYDLIAAFHKVLRQLMFGSGPWDEDLAKIIMELKMPEDAMHQLYDILMQCPVREEADPEEHLIQVLRTSRRAIGAPVLGSWFVGWGILAIGGLVVGWLVVGCWLVGWLLVGWFLVVGWLVVSGWWLVVGWSVGAWWFVGLLLVLCGWWVGFELQGCSEPLGNTPSNLERRWSGAGGGMLWLGRWLVGSVVRRLDRKPIFSVGFSRFLEGQANREPTPRPFTTPRFSSCVFKVLLKNEIFVEAMAQFLILAWRRLPKSLFTT